MVALFSWPDVAKHARGRGMGGGAGVHKVVFVGSEILDKLISHRQILIKIPYISINISKNQAKKNQKSV